MKVSKKQLNRAMSSYASSVVAPTAEGFLAMANELAAQNAVQKVKKVHLNKQWLSACAVALVLIVSVPMLWAMGVFGGATKGADDAPGADGGTATAPNDVADSFGVKIAANDYAASQVNVGALQSGIKGGYTLKLYSFDILLQDEELGAIVGSHEQIFTVDGVTYKYIESSTTIEDIAYGTNTVLLFTYDGNTYVFIAMSKDGAPLTADEYHSLITDGKVLDFIDK